jgi:hypothetical protein
MEPIVAFYLHEGTDHIGRTLKQMWSFTDEQLEKEHDYIQWLFPTQTKSKFNFDAPILTIESICEFVEYDEAVANLIVSSFIFQKFLKLEEETPFWIKRNHLSTHGTRDNHNCLRISRVIESLNSLEQYHRAESFYKSVLKVYVKNNPSPLYHWELANYKFGEENHQSTTLAREINNYLIGSE